MSILQYDELTQITLQVVTSQSETDDLIQEIRGSCSFRQ